MTQKTHRTQVEILKDFVDAISVSEGACSQLIHAQRDPRFMALRDALQLSKEGIMMLTTAGFNPEQVNTKRSIIL